MKNNHVQVIILDNIRSYTTTVSYITLNYIDFLISSKANTRNDFNNLISNSLVANSETADSIILIAVSSNIGGAFLKRLGFCPSTSYRTQPDATIFFALILLSSLGKPNSPLIAYKNEFKKKL